MSAKRQARFEQLRETSKERIERAAMELFARNGFGNTSISQIAEAAGISKGLMYNYYESKEALLKAIVQRGMELGEGMVSSIIEQVENPGQILRLIVEASFGEVMNNPGYWKLMTSLSLQEDVMKTIAPEVEAKRKEMLVFGENIFSQLGYPKPREQAMLFGAVMDGVMMNFVLSPPDYPLESVKKLLVEQFCKPFRP